MLPITDLISYFLSLKVMCEFQITKILKLMHDPESLLTALNTKNTLEPDDSSCPHSGFYRVSKATVHSVSFPEGSS